MVVVDWLRRVFAGRSYASASAMNSSTPNDVVKLMAHAVLALGLRGFAAPAPFRVARRRGWTACAGLRQRNLSA